MTFARTERSSRLSPMHRIVQLLLVPFWAVGFILAMVALVVLFMWNAGRTGWTDAFDRHGGNR